MTDYAIISDDPKAFFLGRYSTLERASKAVDGNFSGWLLYKVVNSRQKPCPDFGRCNCQKDCQNGVD